MSADRQRYRKPPLDAFFGHDGHPAHRRLVGEKYYARAKGESIEPAPVL